MFEFLDKITKNLKEGIVTYEGQMFESQSNFTFVIENIDLYMAKFARGNGQGLGS